MKGRGGSGSGLVAAEGEAEGEGEGVVGVAVHVVGTVVVRMEGNGGAVGICWLVGVGGEVMPFLSFA